MEIVSLNEVCKTLAAAGLRVAGDRAQIAMQLLPTGECRAKASCSQAQHLALEALIGDGRWKISAGFGGVLLIST